MSVNLTLATFGSELHFTLLDLSAALEMPTDDLSQFEFLHEYTQPNSCSADAFLQNFQPDRISMWFRVLASSLTIATKLYAGDEMLEICLTHENMASLDVINEWIYDYTVERVEVRITILKDLILQRLRKAAQCEISSLFFYENSLTKRLALGRLQDLIDEGFLSENQHSVCVVATETGLLQSPLVTIIGLNDSTADDFAVHPTPNACLRAWRRAQALRDTTCTWAVPLATIPPDAFDVVEIRPGLLRTKQQVIHICGTLSLLQFCVSLRIEGISKWTAIMSLPGDSRLSVPMIPENSESVGPREAELRAAYRMYRWAFRAESYDKIDIVRDLVRQEVRVRGSESIEQILQLSPDLLETARATFNILRRQAFEAYARARDQARESVETFVDSVQQKLNTLRRDVLDTTLKFSAAIIAFLTVDVLKPDISKGIVTLGLLFGLAYLALTVVLQLIPLWTQYVDARVRAESNVNDLRELTRSQRDEIVSRLPAKEGCTPFAKWFAISCLVYVGWAIVMGIVFVLVLGGNSNGTPQPTVPTPTPTP